MGGGQSSPSSIDHNIFGVEGSIVNLSVGPAITVGTGVSPSAAFKAWIGWGTVVQYPLGRMTKKWVVRSVVTVVEMALASMF